MSYSLFLSEPSEDINSGPYRVLCGLAVEDVNIWDFVRMVRDANRFYFGTDFSKSKDLLADPSKMLNHAVFENSKLHSAFILKDRLRLTAEALAAEGEMSLEQVAALSQSKIAYCEFVLGLARDYGAHAFISVSTHSQALATPSGQLRKDYSFLFERFFYFLESRAVNNIGYILRVDHLKEHRVKSQEIIDYFRNTTNGRLRSKLIIPDPVFVRNELNRIVELAGIIAYVLNWGYRLRGMVAPVRSELSVLANLISALRFANVGPSGKKNWSFKFIEELSLPGAPID